LGGLKIRRGLCGVSRPKAVRLIRDGVFGPVLAVGSPYKFKRERVYALDGELPTATAD
jgi:hypothetical protein